MPERKDDAELRRINARLKALEDQWVQFTRLREQIDRDWAAQRAGYTGYD